MSILYNFIIFVFFSCSILALCRETSDDDHECARACSNKHSSRKTCVYIFSVTETRSASSFCNKSEDKDKISTCANHTVEGSRLAINGKSPGPAIQVCLGDTIEVIVYNKLGNDELAVHWHGIRQKGFNYMDGVPMITQCPILPFSGFRYKIYPESAGTYFYHAHSGERLDGVLAANQAIGKYALDILGLRDCRDMRHETYIFYEDAAINSYTLRAAESFDEQALKIAESGHHCHRISKNVICSLDLKSKKLSQLEEKADETIYVPFDTNTFSFTDEMTDYSYKFYISRYYPSYLSLEKGATKIPQINGMSFKYPSSPILSQPENIIQKLICTLNERSSECADTPLFCECLQLIQILPRKTVEIVLIDEGLGSNVSHTFHLHGYNASIMGRKSFERPVTKDDIVSLDRDGRIHRNLMNPVQKDTFVVPNKGYIILRFYTDNLGYWLWEARSTAVYPQLFGPGMQFLMRVGLHQNLPPVPIDFPSCGNNKGIDLIFENF